MIVTIAGIGLWGPGLGCWADLEALLRGGAKSVAEFQTPKPDAIPPRERRRAGLTINLAVEVMHQACDMAAVDKSQVGTVFSSAMGDTDITDYMCRKLATEEKLLSPTKFHNSVHNAASGYWSISAGNRCPSTFVGGFRDSFALGLLEGASCSLAHDLPVGIAVYDIANEPPFHDVLRIDEPLGLALLLQPGWSAGGWSVSLSLEPGHGEPPMPEHPDLARLAQANPAGTGFALLEHLAFGSDGDLSWPLGQGSLLRLRAADGAS